MTVPEPTLDLPEVSGKITVRTGTNAYSIAKIVPDFDIERDRGSLVAIPLPGTLSTAESAMMRIDYLHQYINESQRKNDENFQDIKSGLNHTNEILNITNNILNITKEELNITNNILNGTKEELQTERSKNDYYFGALTTIRVWSKLLYERVIEKEKENKKKKKKKPKSFNEFFRDLIYQNAGEETDLVKTMKNCLGLSDDDIVSIRRLVWSKNLHAHGETEFFDSLAFKNRAAIKEGFEQLKENMKDLQHYKGKDSHIVKIATTFLQNIQQDLLNRKLLIN